MKKEIKPIVTVQIHRDLSDCLKPRYMAKYNNQVVADGRTPNEAKSGTIAKMGQWVEPHFVLMVK